MTIADWPETEVGDRQPCAFDRQFVSVLVQTRRSLGKRLAVTPVWFTVLPEFC